MTEAYKSIFYQSINKSSFLKVMHSSRASNHFHSERGRCSNNKQLAVTHAPGVDIEPLEKQNGEERFFLYY